LREAQILLVEDNPGDVALIHEGLRESEFAPRIHVAQDGSSALEYLRRCAQNQPDARRPDVVLLDLNLPDCTGHQILEKIRADPKLSLLPVVIMTSSSRDRDVSESYRLHANCHVTKPVSFDDFVRVIRSIEQFWLGVVELPPVSQC
jgi:chemotaxis family two-component system response regulator Rcp1